MHTNRLLNIAYNTIIIHHQRFRRLSDNLNWWQTYTSIWYMNYHLPLQTKEGPLREFSLVEV